MYYVITTFGYEQVTTSLSKVKQLAAKLSFLNYISFDNKAEAENHLDMLLKNDLALPMDYINPYSNNLLLCNCTD